LAQYLLNLITYEVFEMMALGVSMQWFKVGGLVAVFCSLAAAQQSTRQGSLDFIINAMEKAQSQVHSPIPYVIIREYRLSSANSPAASSNVVAEVDFRPPSSKGYKIEQSSGSSRAQQVVRRILDREVEAASNSNNAKAALVRTNYDFTDMGETVMDGHDCYLLGLKPKRRAPDLILGQAWVDKSSFSVRRIEGDLVKTPSWWLKRIHVKLTFADVRGSWLQTNMEAVADVRIAGVHTLTSRLVDYRTTDVVAKAQVRER
jgi:hypothetical protein